MKGKIHSETTGTILRNTCENASEGSFCRHLRTRDIAYEPEKKSSEGNLVSEEGELYGRGFIWAICQYVYFRTSFEEWRYLRPFLVKFPWLNLGCWLANLS